MRIQQVLVGLTLIVLIVNQQGLDRDRAISYLTYEVNNNEQVKQQVITKLIEGVKYLGSKYPEIETHKLINDITNTYQLTNNMHMTLAYLGGMTVNQALQQQFKSEKEKNRWTNLLNNIKLGQQISIDLMGFVLVEGKIITGLAFADKEREEEMNIRSVNERSHITLENQEWIAVDSNYVLEQVFSTDKYMLDYSEEFFKNGQVITRKIEMDTQNSWEGDRIYKGQGYVLSFATDYMKLTAQTYCHWQPK